jgi:hypothetical protein
MMQGFHGDINEWWELKDAQAMVEKASQGVLIALVNLYNGLDPEEKKKADTVFAEWLGSDNERKQFDSMAMIERYKISSAINSLKGLRTKLLQRSDPGAPFDLKKVERILDKLES